MMKKFLTALLVIVLLAVICLESYMLFFRERPAQQNIQTPMISLSPVITQAPPPTQAPVTEAPAPTQAPVTPEPVPVTPEPTATPIPASTMPPVTAAPTAGSGSFSSDTGTHLNLLVDWRTEDLGNGNTRVYVDGKVQSYSLNVTGTSVNISFGGRSTTASGSPIDLGDVQLTETALFSATLDVPGGTVGTMTVEWAYKGSYSGVSLPTITATGQVSA